MRARPGPGIRATMYGILDMSKGGYDNFFRSKCVVKMYRLLIFCISTYFMLIRKEKKLTFQTEYPREEKNAPQND